MGYKLRGNVIDAAKMKNNYYRVGKHYRVLVSVDARGWNAMWPSRRLALAC